MFLLVLAGWATDADFEEVAAAVTGLAKPVLAVGASFAVPPGASLAVPEVAIGVDGFAVPPGASLADPVVASGAEFFEALLAVLVVGASLAGALAAATGFALAEVAVVVVAVGAGVAVPPGASLAAPVVAVGAGFAEAVAAEVG